MGVQYFYFTTGPNQLGLAFENRGRAGQKTRRITIIHIEEAQVLAASHANALVPRSCRATVSLAKDGHLHRNIAHQTPSTFHRGVGRAVIHDDDLAIRFLVEQAANATFQMLRSVAAGDDDGHEGVVHGCSP